MGPDLWARTWLILLPASNRILPSLHVSVEELRSCGIILYHVLFVVIVTKVEEATQL